MPDRDNQVITYLTEQEHAQLKQWSDETGKSMSHLLREAVLEYTDRDRTARTEEKVDRILAILESDEHTHTRDAQNLKHKSVPEKARAIVQRIRANHDIPVKGEDVEIAIEDYAGGDDRTIDKYKDQLKKRGLLYKHPMQPVWTDEKRQWVKWVENATVGGDVLDWVSKYDLDTDEYDEIASEVTQ